MKIKTKYQDQQELSSYLKLLHQRRRVKKLKGVGRSSLTQAQRSEILQKTNGRCHFCGIKVNLQNMQADHVKAHCHEGEHMVDNYLPSCATCNNYRWHYLPKELQLILKLGVFVKTHVEQETALGKAVGKSFVAYHQRRIVQQSARTEKKKAK